MKTFMLACEAMAQKPIEALNGKTPLEVAKTPYLDALAVKGRVGVISLVPRSLQRGLSANSYDIACMSALGYDPLEFYTGLAPLEALDRGITADDHEVIFCCDFVTIAEGILTDSQATNIRPQEAKILLDALRKGLGQANAKFVVGEGYRQYLVINDAELSDDLDEVECFAPQSVIGQPIDKFIPKGRAGDFLLRLMHKSREILENHEVNRVRVDLGENPVNQFWLWGQGKTPKMPSFKQRYGIEGQIFSETGFVRGLAKAADMKVGAQSSLENFEFTYFGGDMAGELSLDFRKKIKILEEFDAKIVKMAVQKMALAPGARICAVSVEAGDALYLMHGQGIESNGATAFDEKNCSRSKQVVREGHQLIEGLLK